MGNTTLSKECLSKYQCDACLKPYSETEWTKSQLRWSNYRGTPLVCKACISEGCTLFKPYYFTCQQCGKKKGCRQFNSRQLANYEYHGGPELNCLQCGQENADREKALQTKFKKSK